MNILKIVAGIVVLILLAGLILFIIASPKFGKAPTAAEREAFKGSNQFDPNTGKFFNADKGVIARMQKNFFTTKFFTEQFKAFKNETRPSTPMPEKKPSFDSFMTVNAEDPLSTFKVIWFGHSSFLLNIGGKIILFDPVFGRASPLFFGVSRFQDSIVAVNDLPQVDAVIITHDHYDHLETETISYLATRAKQFIVPLGIGALIKSWGVPSEKITELDWWASTTLDELTITAAPSQHFSGRKGFDGMRTLWASYILSNEQLNIYNSGDSGYTPHFKDIGEKYGPFDLAFLENGQYNITWKEVHLLPEETLQAFKDLNAHRLFPVHWGMFTLAPHDWYDPVKQLSALSATENVSLITPIIGEVIEPLSSTTEYTDWWTPLIKNK